MTSMEIRGLPDWKEYASRIKFHGIEEKSPVTAPYPYCLREEIERYSTPEHTQAWREHRQQMRADRRQQREEQRRRRSERERIIRAEEFKRSQERKRKQKEEDAKRREFARRKKDGTLITRQQIIANGWRVPARPDFVEGLGHGYVRYYYRLPIEVIPIKRRRREESAA